MQTWEEPCKPLQIKSNMDAMVSTPLCVYGMLLAWCSDWVFCVYSLLDASIAEEDIGGDYYYQEEEEEYPGHFANQGKPSFDSYSQCLVLILHSTCFK
jgi:hypothetical protein